MLRRMGAFAVVTCASMVLTVFGPAHAQASARLLWAKRNAAQPSGSSATAIAVSPDGSKVFMTGTPSGGYAAFAHNAANGSFLWRARYAGLGCSIAVNPDGSMVYVQGTVGADYLTAAFDASTGHRVWARRYNGPANGDDGACGTSDYRSKMIAVSSDGSKVFVTGFSQGLGTYNYDYATVAYDARTGAKLWVARYDYNPLANSDDQATAIAVSPDGSTVVVTGFSDGGWPAPGFDFVTLAYDAATGAPRWTQRFDWGSNEWPVAITVSPDSSKVFVTGWGLIAFETVAYDISSGAILWATTWGQKGKDGYPTAIGVSPDGSAVYVTGTAWISDTNWMDYSTVAYDASTGAEIWTKQFNVGFEDGASGLAASPDGTKVFVTGGTSAGMGTIAYEAATGVRLWIRFYNAGASAIAVDPDGTKVFIAGGGSTSSGQSVYVTVAYRS